MRRDIREGEMTEIDQVRETLVKAMLILRMMPLSYQDEPSRMRSQWPEFNRGPEQVGGIMRRPVRAKATPQQIALMEYWLDLMLVLDDACSRTLSKWHVLPCVNPGSISPSSVAAAVLRSSVNSSSRADR